MDLPSKYSGTSNPDRLVPFTGWLHQEHTGTANCIVFESDKSFIRTGERKSLNMCFDRNSRGLGQKLPAVLSRVVGDAADGAFFVDERILEGRDRAHVNPAEYERTAFVEGPECDGDEFTGRCKDDRSI